MACFEELKCLHVENILSPYINRSIGSIFHPLLKTFFSSGRALTNRPEFLFTRNAPFRALPCYAVVMGLKRLLICTGSLHNDRSTIYYYLGKVTKSRETYITLQRHVFNTIIHITHNQKNYIKCIIQIMIVQYLIKIYPLVV